MTDGTGARLAAGRSRHVLPGASRRGRRKGLVKLYEPGAVLAVSPGRVATGRGGPAPAGRKLAVGDRSACPAVLTGRPGKRQEIPLGPAVPCGGGPPPPGAGVACPP